MRMCCLVLPRMLKLIIVFTFPLSLQRESKVTSRAISKYNPHRLLVSLSFLQNVAGKTKWHTHFPVLPLVIISKHTHMHFLAFVGVHYDVQEEVPIFFAGNEGAYYFPWLFDITTIIVLIIVKVPKFETSCCLIIVVQFVSCCVCLQVVVLMKRPKSIGHMNL